MPCKRLCSPKHIESPGIPGAWVLAVFDVHFSRIMSFHHSCCAAACRGLPSTAERRVAYDTLPHFRHLQAALNAQKSDSDDQVRLATKLVHWHSCAACQRPRPCWQAADQHEYDSDVLSLMARAVMQHTHVCCTSLQGLRLTTKPTDVMPRRRPLLQLECTRSARRRWTCCGTTPASWPQS